MGLGIFLVGGVVSSSEFSNITAILAEEFAREVDVGGGAAAAIGAPSSDVPVVTDGVAVEGDLGVGVVLGVLDEGAVGLSGAEFGDVVW